jgi:hypothetical protein
MMRIGPEPWEQEEAARDRASAAAAMTPQDREAIARMYRKRDLFNAAQSGDARAIELLQSEFGMTVKDPFAPSEVKP